MQGRTHSEETLAKIRAALEKHVRGVLFQGQTYPSIAEAARATGLSRTQITYRLRKGEASYVEKE